MESFFKSVFFSPLKFKLSEQENRASEKRAVGLSFFVVVKGITVLQVLIACYIMPCLERKHL